MARQRNDGKGRIGGRAKGTPNRVSATTKEWLASLIDENREQIEKDLKQLQPKERLQILEKLMQYVIPKSSIVEQQQPQVELGELRIGFADDYSTD